MLNKIRDAFESGLVLDKEVFFGGEPIPIRGTAEYLEHLEKRISFLEEVVYDLYQKLN